MFIAIHGPMATASTPYAFGAILSVNSRFSASRISITENTPRTAEFSTLQFHRDDFLRLIDASSIYRRLISRVADQD